MPWLGMRRSCSLVATNSARGSLGSFLPQQHREKAGEPADRAREINIIEQIFAAVAFERDQQRARARPGRPGAHERGQQHIVDLGMVGLGHLLEQRAGLIGAQRDRDAARGGDGVGAGGHIERHGWLGATNLVKPVGQLLPKRARAGVFRQAPGPLLVGGGLGRQRDRLPLPKLLVGALKVFQQNPPGDAVDRQVVDDDQQATSAPDAQIEEHSTQAGRTGQIEGGLQLRRRRLDRGLMGRLGQGRQIGPRQG